MNISALAKKVIAFKKTEQCEEVEQRLKEFNFEQKNHHKWFSELCFCLLTANTSAESGIRCQNALDDKFLSLNEIGLSRELKRLKYRFPNKRAQYIRLAQDKCRLLSKVKTMDSRKAREFLVHNIKGLGMKEASHFLRNTGRKDVAIIDRHILRSLGYQIRSFSPKKYEEIEQDLKRLSDITSTNLAELDLILWTMQTGKVLK